MPDSEALLRAAELARVQYAGLIAEAEHAARLVVAFADDLVLLIDVLRDNAPKLGISVDLLAPSDEVSQITARINAVGVSDRPRSWRGLVLRVADTETEVQTDPGRLVSARSTLPEVEQQLDRVRGIGQKRGQPVRLYFEAPDHDTGTPSFDASELLLAVLSAADDDFAQRATFKPRCVIAS